MEPIPTTPRQRALRVHKKRRRRFQRYSIRYKQSTDIEKSAKTAIGRDSVGEERARLAKTATEDILSGNEGRPEHRPKESSLEKGLQICMDILTGGFHVVRTGERIPVVTRAHEQEME